MAPIHLIDGTGGQRLPLKPDFGSPCNGCGMCCAIELCALALDMMPDHSAEGPCRALEHDAGRFVCGLIRHASHYLPDFPNNWADAHLGELFATALGAGMGCNADDPDPPLIPSA